MKKTTPPPLGQFHIVRYPFSRTTYDSFYDDESKPIKCWRPGCDRDADDDGNVTWSCEGHGEMLLEVVGEFKPGRFPARVFYVRQWRDPDGKVFGIGKLRMTTRTNFDRMLKGYRHNYEES
jgi:hypothetical protein